MLGHFGWCAYNVNFKYLFSEWLLPDSEFDDVQEEKSITSFIQTLSRRGHEKKSTFVATATAEHPQAWPGRFNLSCVLSSCLPFYSNRWERQEFLFLNGHIQERTCSWMDTLNGLSPFFPVALNNLVMVLINNRSSEDPVAGVDGSFWVSVLNQPSTQPKTVTQR